MPHDDQLTKINSASVTIALRLAYESIPVPPQITIQLEPGDFKLIRRIRYCVNSEAPLRVINLKLQHDFDEHLQIAMELTGGIDFEPGGTFNFDGTHLMLMCTPVIADNHLVLQNPIIKEIDFPKIPRLFERIARAIVNKSFVPNLEKSLHFELEDILDEVRKKINELEPVELAIGPQKYLFQISPRIGEVSHELIVAQDAVHLNLELAFSPHFSFEPS